MSEYNILNTLQQMTMTANTYKTQTGTLDKAIAELLIVGFSGQLKGWWDYHLTKTDHLYILNSFQTYEDQTPIIDPSGNIIPDVVLTLILTISLHFVGDPSHMKDKNADLLSNLRCLPILLGEKVRNKIKDTFTTKTIPYDQLTYGELVSFTQKEDLKLQKHLRWEMKRTRQELGSFCHQFDLFTKKPSYNGNYLKPKTKPPYKKSSHKYHDFKLDIIALFNTVTKDINHTIILGTPFIDMITPYKAYNDCITSKINSIKLVFPFLEKSKTKNLNLIKACSIHTYHINVLIHEKQFHLHDLQNHVSFYRIDKQLQNSILQKKINDLQKKHIPTKTRPIQMNVDLEHHCRLEIQDLESKSLIQKSKSPWKIMKKLKD
uniref:DUF7746 domain-containing protein n=1 Tax=Populus trichocarpa TaxID=3694 RepID=A0A2K1YHU2_POPTR